MRGIKVPLSAADQRGVARNFTDGARLMRASFDVVRGDPRLLWFPAISTLCLAITAGFWVFEGAYVYVFHAAWFFYVPIVAAGIYTATFVGIFFSVALAAAAAELLDGGEPTFSDGVDIAFQRLGGITVWAAYSMCVSVFIWLIESIKGLRLIGAAAQIAWNFATIFVVPLIVYEGLDASTARKRSFELAKENWRAESAGLGVLRAVLLVPAVLTVVAGEALKSGQVHSLTGKVILGAAVVCGFGVIVAANVVRQVFAVSLYRTAAR